MRVTFILYITYLLFQKISNLGLPDKNELDIHSHITFKDKQKNFLLVDGYQDFL